MIVDIVLLLIMKVTVLYVTAYTYFFYIIHGGIAQLVEHLLCKQRVTGSSPVTSTTVAEGFSSGLGAWLNTHTARVPAGIAGEYADWMFPGRC